MILKFSIPAAISLLITAIYNIVDRIFVGNFNGTSALAGLSVCFPLSYMMMAFGLTCSAGGSTLFSLFAGKNDTDKMNKAFGNAFVLVCIFEILLSVVLLVFADPFLRIFGVTDTSYEYAIAYYKIVALGCLFQGLTQLFCDFVRVSGKPVLGMCVTGIGAVTNIILDAAFGGSEEMFAIGITGLRLNFCITPILGVVLLVTTFFQSVGRPVPSIVITVLRQVVFLIPFIYISPIFWGVESIFIAQPVSDALALLLSLLLVWQEHRELLGKENNG